MREARRQLESLEKWRSAELESAQAQHARLSRTADEKESARDRVQAGLDDTQAFARERLTSSQPISPESLRQIGEFAALQRRDLAVAQPRSKNHVRIARPRANKWSSSSKSFSVVQRLAKRRELEAGRDARALQQKRLDEQALSRLAAESDLVRSNRQE